ncbi:MAG TPA: PDZ domain-containing protein [Pseudonocardiaceae bacterium]|nr:PDZ domain-containing protein [Pseudonocardiaceae bacterium]
MNARGESETDPDVAAQPAPEAPVPPAQESSSPPPRRRGLSRRGWTLVCSFVLLVVFGLIGGLVQVPYVALGPGPTFDTLGADDTGATIVSISGHQTYPTNGQLRMVTVSLQDQVTLFDALGLWMSGRYQLAPREEYYTPGESEQQVDQQNVEEFQESQSNAEVSAMRYLKYPIEVLAQTVVKGSAADGNIKPGDQLIVVNGKQINSTEDVTDALADTKPGQNVALTVRTGSQAARNLNIKLGSTSGRSQGFLGVAPGAEAQIPFKVDIGLPNIGGPSAGLMFALAVVDKLTPGGVNGGMSVAGTGEIDDLGRVSEIGGIPFKLVAAREAGATVFLTPADNCAEAKAHAPAGLRLVKVTTLSSAVQELAALRTGQPVPGC